MGIAPEIEQVKTDEALKNKGNNENKEENTKTPEEKVKTILKTAGIDIENESDEFKKDVLSKYNTMVMTAKSSNQELDDDTIKTRLSNYVKALRFHEIEIRANKGEDVAYENKECSSAKTEDEAIKKYKQFGAEYVELYDQNGDKSIDIHELFFLDLIDIYKTRGYSSDKAKQKAIAMTEKYKDNSILKQPTDDSFESEIFRQAANKISVIDTAKGANADSKISTEEAAAYLISMAQVCDNKNQITKSEFNGSEYGIKYTGCSLDEIQEEENCSKENANKIKDFVKKFNDNLNFFMQFFTK